MADIFWKMANFFCFFFQKKSIFCHGKWQKISASNQSRKSPKKKATLYRLNKRLLRMVAQFRV
jgi:hypothetical protein